MPQTADMNRKERSTSNSARPGSRLVWLDLARTFALVGMVVFHSARDLEFLGLLAPQATLTGGWALFARIVAGTFLFLSGVSFVLAHGSVFRARAWVKRLLVIVGAACLVSAVSFAAFPSRFIYFGILHAIAVCSLIGPLFLRLSTRLSFCAVLFVLAVDAGFGRALFQSPWLAWTGLSSDIQPALDFIPVVPWFAAFLAGMTVAKAVPPAVLEPPWTSTSNLAVLVAWPGRHSLMVYLVHQPLLLGLIWGFVWASGAPM